MSYGIEKTPKEVTRLLGEHLEMLRKERKMSRADLSERSGVPAPTLRKFEQTGMISLEALLKLAKVFGRLDEFEHLLEPRIDERRRHLFDD